MRIRLGFAATLALVVVVVLGTTGTSAAPTVEPGKNAIVNSSGAASAIVAGPGLRPPRSSSVLGGAMENAVAAKKRTAVVGSSAFTHLAE